MLNRLLTGFRPCHEVLARKTRYWKICYFTVIVTMLVTDHPVAGFLALLILTGILAWKSAQRSMMLERMNREISGRVAEKEQLEAQMRSYIDDVRAAHQRAMKAVEDAQQADYAKSQFLANMSHELRTPMNGIIGMVGMLEETALTAEQKEFTAVISRSAKSLLLIVNDILDLSKIEAESMELEIKPFDIRRATSETADLFVPLANEKGIALAVDIHREFPRFVDGDEGRFIQILRNLLSNAIKFTDHGSVVLAAKRDEDGELVLSVTDTGIGIPPEHMEKIFEKFQQGNNTSTRRYGGTGLGLAICKQLVGMMGGGIAVESVIKKGSVFSFHLPLIVRNDIDEIVERFVPRPDSEESNVFGFRTDARILLAEDHPANQFLMKKLLKKMGFTHIDVAENGRAALEVFDLGGYDIVLMDCQMPEMDGYESTGWIRRLEEGRASRVPIIAMTANAMIGDRERCLDAGMDDYISKPIDAKKFSAILARWLPGTDQITRQDGHDDSNHHEKSDGPIDITHLETFTDGDPETERELFNIFCEQAELAMLRLESACGGEASFDEWKSAAHRFKGASANLGAHRLSELCFAAETGFMDEEKRKHELLRAIRASYLDVQRFLQVRQQENQ